MKERVSGFFESIKTMWQGASKIARIVVLAVTAAILLFCLGMVLFLNRTNDVLLFNHYSLSVQENAAAFRALNEAGIEARTDGISGSVYVAEKDAAQARMVLATQGYDNSALNYETYNSVAGSLTATKTDKDIAVLHEMQDRLQASIESYDEINQAIVNISLSSSNNFALEPDNTPASASITLRKKPGAELTREQIQAILNVVRYSVAGLTEENISISDENGDLKPYLEATSTTSASKLELTEQVNNSIRNNITSLLYPVYGADHVGVSVSSTLNNNQEVREEERFLPFDEDNPQNNPLQRAEYYRDKIGGAAPNIAQGVPGANDNTDVPQYAVGDLDLADGDSYTANDTLDYLVSSVREQIVKEGYDIEDMTVAVVIDAETLPAGDRDKIIDLVSSASGVPNDKVSVQNIKFTTTTGLDLGSNGQDFPEEINWMLYGAIAAAGVALLVIALLVILHLRNKKKLALAAAAAAEAEAAAAAGMDMEGAEYDEDGNLLVDLMGQEDDFEPITLAETPEQKLKAQIKDLAENDPEIVAQLLKTWLVSG